MPTEILRPNAAGDETSLSISGSSPAPTNWQSVDEVVADDSVTYIYGTGLDLYNLPAHIGSGTINSVKVYARFYQSSGSQRARIKIKTGGAEYDNGVDIDPPSSWTDYSKQWDLNPNTAAGWTWDEIDALQIGVLGIAGTGTVRTTQVYVEVDYTPYYHGLKIQGEGELALCDVGTNSLRIRKGGVTYGLELVDTGDSNASRIRIQTGSGIKSIRKYT